MTFNKLTKLTGKIAAANIFVIMILILAGSVFANSGVSTGMTGVWQLKRTVTEKKPKEIKAGFLAAMTTPESLVLAVEEGNNEVTINEGFKEFIQTQTIPTNGNIVRNNIQQIGKVSSKAVWQNGKLFVEVITAQGDKITEIFELSANRKQLNVTIQLTGNNSAEILKVRRVYQRVAEVDEDNTAEVEIASYPL